MQKAVDRKGKNDIDIFSFQTVITDLLYKVVQIKADFYLWFNRTL